jgi:hypothetical protein
MNGKKGGALVFVLPKSICCIPLKRPLTCVNKLELPVASEGYHCQYSREQLEDWKEKCCRDQKQLGGNVEGLLLWDIFP